MSSNTKSDASEPLTDAVARRGRTTIEQHRAGGKLVTVVTKVEPDGSETVEITGIHDELRLTMEDDDRGREKMWPMTSTTDRRPA